MSQPDGKHGITTQTACDKLRKEKNVAVKELEALQQKHNLALQHNEALKRKLSCLEENDENKNKAVEKYKSKYEKAKKTMKELKENSCRLEKQAESTEKLIENLHRAKKSLEEEKKKMRWELEQRKNKFLLSTLKQGGIMLHSNRNEYHSSRGYNARYALEHTRSPVEHRHRR